jgi:hypothetical protein
MDGIGAIIDLLSPFGTSHQALQRAGAFPSNDKMINVTFGDSNPVYQLAPGVPKADLDRIEQQYQQKIAKAQADVLDEFKRLFGG